jgi:hypothetical protein
MEDTLSNSSVHQRKEWIIQMIKNKFSILDFMNVMQKDKKTAMRFSWMLSELGMYQKEFLFEVLPILFMKRDEVQLIPFEQSFMNYWLIAGIPKENETVAIELCFKLLNSPGVNVSIQSRALKLLMKLVNDYPELKSELKLCLERPLIVRSKDFRKRIEQAMERLN